MRCIRFCRECEANFHIIDNCSGLASCYRFIELMAILILHSTAAVSLGKLY